MAQKAAKVILSGIDHYRFTEAMTEGMRIILTYHGEPHSAAYFQGISGAAFRMAGICNCAPTCSNIIEPAPLAELFGYQVETLPLDGESLEREQKLHDLLIRIKDEIRSKRPVLLWHAFTSMEWDVVCGFDEAEGVFYGRGSYLGLGDYASAPETRTLTCLDIIPAMRAVLVGDKIREYDSHQAEINALREAVRHGKSRKEILKPFGEWEFLEGIQCYQRWAHEFHEDPGRGRTKRDSYCIGIYRSTRRAAALFLREITAKYPGAAVDLRRGQHAFEKEFELLDRCAPFLGWDTPEAPDQARNQRVADLLEQAGEHYADGIDAVERALAKIDPQ